jgi:hypothetical protein
MSVNYSTCSAWIGSSRAARIGDRRFAVTPNEVRADPERHEAHWRRALDAELAFPIDLLRRERLIILDGVHCLLKADTVDLRTIEARVLDASSFAEIVDHG